MAILVITNIECLPNTTKVISSDSYGHKADLEIIDLVDRKPIYKLGESVGGKNLSVLLIRLSLLFQISLTLHVMGKEGIQHSSQ